MGDVKWPRAKKVDWFLTWQRTYEVMAYADHIQWGMEDEFPEKGTMGYILHLFLRVINNKPITYAGTDSFHRDISRYFVNYTHSERRLILECFDIEEDFEVIIKKMKNTIEEYKKYYQISQDVANREQQEDLEFFRRWDGSGATGDENEDLEGLDIVDDLSKMDERYWDERYWKVFEEDEAYSRQREEEYLALQAKRARFSEQSNAARAMGLYVWYLSNYEEEKYPTIVSAINDLRELELEDKNVLEALGRDRYIDTSTVRKYYTQTVACIEQQTVLPFSA